jgi:hypothetical protein
MERFSSRLRTYLKENNISQSRFAKVISQESKHNFKCTLRKVHRWTKAHEPRISTFEGAYALKIIHDWEKSQGLHSPPPKNRGVNLLLKPRMKETEYWVTKKIK